MDVQQVHHIIEQMANAMMRQDENAVADFFAEDGVMISPAGCYAGGHAIREVCAAFNRDYTNIVIHIQDVIVCGNKGVVEWRFAETRKADGYTHVMEDAIVFHLRDDKIVYWREYFDPAQIDVL